MKEKKRFVETVLWKCIRTLLEILLIVAAIWAGVALWDWFSTATAEEWDEHEQEYEIAYAICSKDDHVNIRPFPSTKHAPSGWLDPGDVVYMDGKKRNGYVHCVGMNVEAGEGWVHHGYLVADPPDLVDRDATITCYGKLAARKYVNGKRIRWLRPEGTVHVWYMSEEWCSTNCGYVQTKYLEINGE